MVTLKHIAEKAGVTVSVVSRALNPRPDKHARVAPETKAKIEEVAQALGFRRNRGAEFLKRGLSPVIQVYMPTRANCLTAELMYGMAEAAEKEDFSLSFSRGATDACFSRFLAEAIQNRSCGVLTCHHYLEPDFWNRIPPETFSALRMVSINPRCPLPPGISSVSLGYQEAGTLAAKHLMEKQCQSLAVVGRAPLRSAGFMGASHASNRTAISFTPSNIDSFVEWVREAPKPAGVFAMTDILALKVIHRLLQAGLRVPDDVRVIGHDNLSFTPHMEPPLTTIRQQLQEEGRESIRMIVKLIYGEPVTSVVIPPALVIRESA